MLSFNSKYKGSSVSSFDTLFYSVMVKTLKKAPQKKDHENGAEAVEVFGVAIEGIKSIFQYQMLFFEESNNSVPASPTTPNLSANPDLKTISAFLARFFTTRS